jgi:hypothetical protein
MSELQKRWMCSRGHILGRQEGFTPSPHHHLRAQLGHRLDDEPLNLLITYELGGLDCDLANLLRREATRVEALSRRVGMTVGFASCVWSCAPVLSCLLEQRIVMSTDWWKPT